MNGTSVHLAQALRGPVMLITLGALLAADHMRNVDFWKTWPVLIIVFGAMKLVETLTRRSAASRQEGTGS